MGSLGDIYTKSLLHFDGADASTTFTDESGKTWTNGGDAQIDTAQSVFGGASGLFDGNEDYIITSAALADFNMQTAGDWTVDFRIRPTSVAGTHTIAHFHKTADVRGLHIYSNGTALLVDNGSTASGISAGTIAINTWYHVAVTRQSGTTKLWLDGTLIDSEAAQDYGDNDSYCMIGRYYGGAATGEFAGHVDEFRVSKGIARWTANFTPPTRAYGGGGQFIRWSNG